MIDIDISLINNILTLKTIDQDLMLMDKYRLSAEELLLSRILILARYEEKISYLKEYIRLHNYNSFIDTLKQLKNKSILLTDYKLPVQGGTFKISDIKFNKIFVKNFYKSSGELGEELFSNYPSHITSKGVRYMLNNITKGYDSLEDMFYDYGRIIKFDLKKHKEIMELLNFAKENDMICYSIVEFIKSRKWDSIKADKESGDYLNGSMNIIQSL